MGQDMSLLRGEEMYKEFDDGNIYTDSTGILITLRSRFYSSNDIYSLQHCITWDYLYRIPLDQRTAFITYILDKTQKEYGKLNGRG